MKKILLVDDDETILEAVKLVLETEGYETLSADCLEKARELVRKKPDLILLDLLLSGNDSSLIVSQLKSDAVTKSIPIVIFSALMNAREIAFNAGADDFLAKPFEINDLTDIVARNLNKEGRIKL